jgi:hypothetical protein
VRNFCRLNRIITGSGVQAQESIQKKSAPGLFFQFRVPLLVACLAGCILCYHRYVVVIVFVGVLCPCGLLRPGRTPDDDPIVPEPCRRDCVIFFMFSWPLLFRCTLLYKVLVGRSILLKIVTRWGVGPETTLVSSRKIRGDRQAGS